MAAAASTLCADDGGSISCCCSTAFFCGAMPARHCDPFVLALHIPLVLLQVLLLAFWPFLVLIVLWAEPPLAVELSSAEPLVEMTMIISVCFVFAT